MIRITLKLSLHTTTLLAATLLLTGSLNASSTHKVSATQEGVIAVKLFDTALKTNLTQKLQVENKNVTVIEICITEADRTMKQMNSELPTYVTMSIASLDANKTLHATDVQIMKKYEKDIKSKTAAAMMITTAKVGNTTRVYKPLIIDNIWLKCHGNTSEVKLGDFKGVIISEVSKH